MRPSLPVSITIHPAQLNARFRLACLLMCRYPRLQASARHGPDWPYTWLRDLEPLDASGWLNPTPS